MEKQDAVCNQEAQDRASATDVQSVRRESPSDTDSGRDSTKGGKPVKEPGAAANRLSIIFSVLLLILPCVGWFGLLFAIVALVQSKGRKWGGIVAFAVCLVLGMLLRIMLSKGGAW